MAKRCYHQHCGLARALDRLGERWTLLIVRELLLGSRRYSQLLDSLDGITTNLLALRLKEMEENEIVAKSGSGPSTRYQLSSRGEQLEPVVMELARWGGQFMSEFSPGDRIDLGWALLSRKRVYRGGSQIRVGILAEKRQFELTFTSEKLWVKERAAVGAELYLEGTTPEILALLFEGTLAPKLEIKESSRGSMLRFLAALEIKIRE